MEHTLTPLLRRPLPHTVDRVSEDTHITSSLDALLVGNTMRNTLTHWISMSGCLSDMLASGVRCNGTLAASSPTSPSGFFNSGRKLSAPTGNAFQTPTKSNGLSFHLMKTPHSLAFLIESTPDARNVLKVQNFSHPGANVESHLWPIVCN